MGMSACASIRQPCHSFVQYLRPPLPLRRQVAVTADLAHPHNRLIVDDYELAEDKQSYRLRTVGTGEHGARVGLGLGKV